MGVQFLHGGDRRDLDGAVVKVRDIAGAAIRRDVNGAQGQPIIYGIHFIEDDRWFTLRCALPKELDVLGPAQISPHRFFIGTGSPNHFGQHHQIIDVLGVHAEHILVGVEVKQILTTIVFFELPDHAPDQPFPVSAAAGQSQPAEFFCPESVTDLQQQGERIGVVGDEKERRDLLWLHPDFERRARIGYPGQNLPLVIPSISVLAKVSHVFPRFPAYQEPICPAFAGRKILRPASSSSNFLARASTMAWQGFS